MNEDGQGSQGLDEVLGGSDHRNRHAIASASVGIRTSTDVFKGIQEESERARGGDRRKWARYGPCRDLVMSFGDLGVPEEEGREMAGGIERRSTSRKPEKIAMPEDLIGLFSRIDERNRQNVMRANLGMRTSADIFRAAQKEHGEGRVLEKAKRKRIRGPKCPQSSVASLDDQPATKRARLQERSRAGRSRGRRVARSREGTVNDEPVTERAIEQSENQRMMIRGLSVAQFREESVNEEAPTEQGIEQSEDQRRGTCGSRIAQFREGTVNNQAPAEQAMPESEARRRKIRGLRVAQSSREGVNGQVSRKRASAVLGQGRNQSQERYDDEGRDEGEEREESQREELGRVLQNLEEEFAEKERLSHGLWCEPIPKDRQVSTVCDFYGAFHDVKTMPIYTCSICYRKFGMAELVDVEWSQWMSTPMGRHASQFGCDRCFPLGGKVLGCTECVKDLGRGVLSAPACLHDRLGCEHMLPDELKGLSPVEEKLIALNTCYGFITKHAIVGGQRQSTSYPKHVKGHIIVFPNNVQELATNVLPHPLLKAMEDVHVSWQGAEKPKPSDLSVLLSVRPRAVRNALVWLKEHNPLYSNVEIDEAEMESWGAPAHGVLAQIYERLQRNEPSAWEKARTGQVVPPTERGLEEGRAVDIREVLMALQMGEDMDECPGSNEDEYDDERVQFDGVGATIQEISSSGMFALDGQPDVADAEKLNYINDALGREAPSD